MSEVQQHSRYLAAYILRPTPSREDRLRSCDAFRIKTPSVVNDEKPIIHSAFVSFSR